MKKIIILITVVIFSNGAFSQNVSGQGNGNESKPAVAVNGAKEATINGIPYSQYKAQQDALKKQQQFKNTDENQSGTLSSKAAVVPTTQQDKIARPDNSANTTNTGLAIPASENKVMNSKESNSLSGDIVQPKPSNAVKTVKSEVASEEGKPAANNLTVTMVPVGSDAIAPTVVQPAVKTVLPEVKADGPVGPVKMEEVPASVVNPEVKKPEVSKQGTRGQQ